jgi:hypothetical protein
VSRLTTAAVLLLCLLLCGTRNLARAQNVSPFFGLGTARDSPGTSVKEGCPAGQLFDGVVCENSTKMSGLFGLFGVDFMFKKHLGVSGEYAFRFKRATFLPGDGLTVRPSFYDLNALWQPGSGSRLIPFFQAGIGVVKISEFLDPSASITGVTSTSGFSAGSYRNHFQFHAAAGAKLYVHGNIFVKPQFDLHYAAQLTDQYGRNLIIQFMGSVGYTFGAH